MLDLVKLERFDFANAVLPGFPFPHLPRILQQARYCLGGKTVWQVISIAKQINSILNDQGRGHFNGRPEDYVFINLNLVDELKKLMEIRRYGCPGHGNFLASFDKPEGTDSEFFAVLTVYLVMESYTSIGTFENAYPGQMAIEAMEAICYAEHLQEMEFFVSGEINSLRKDVGDEYAGHFQSYLEHVKRSQNTMMAQLQVAKSDLARKAAEARHSQPNGYRQKSEQIKRIWASGKYKSRDECALKECASLGISPSTARKHLRNTPNPA